MRRIAFALLLAVLAAVGVQNVVAAQESTPTAGQAPSPDLCTLEPVSFEFLESAFASPVPVDDETAASPVASPAGDPFADGEPVDEETRQAVEESMIINVACINTGVPLLQFAVYTEDGLRLLLANVSGITQADYEELEQAAQPLTEDQWTILIEFQEMVQLDDGRVAALIVGDDPMQPEPPSTTLFYLLERDGHWYIDALERNRA